MKHFGGMEISLYPKYLENPAYTFNRLNEMGETLSGEKAEVIKVDKVTLKHLKFPLILPRSSEEETLRAARNGCNVGDFLQVSGKTYRRIRGGFRLATDEDMAELLASQLGLLEE